MIKTYKNTLNIGEYGEYFFDYDESEYIADIISYIADAKIDIYDWELWEWAKDNKSYIEDAIAQGFYSIDAGSFDLMDLFRAGQYEYITSDLYDNLDDIIAYAVLDEVQDEFINKQRLVEVIQDTCYNVDNNDTIEHYIDVVRDTMQDYPMLEIHLSTGTAWTESIVVEGTPDDDLLELIDNYYLEHGDLPVPMYTLEDLLQGQFFKSEHQQWDYIDSLEMLPINGGEFFIDGIDSVEEVI